MTANRVVALDDSLRGHIVQQADGWVEIGFDIEPERPTPAVSVIVQTYKHERFIAETLESIVSQQTSFDFEVLVGEDGSPDGTRNICVAIAKKYPHKIRLILHDRTKAFSISGRPTGRFNIMTNFQLARGRYTAICEGDDYWQDPLKLQKQFELLEREPSVALSYHDCCTVDENGNLISESLLGDAGKDLTQIELIRGSRIPTLTAMYRTRDLDDLPPVFLEVLNGDTFIFAHLGMKGVAKFQGEILPAAYRVHSGGIWSAASAFTKSNDLIKTFQALSSVTTGEFRNAAMKELHRKYTARILACIQQRKPREMLSTTNRYRQDFGTLKVPSLFFSSLRACLSKLASRTQRRK